MVRFAAFADTRGKIAAAALTLAIVAVPAVNAFAVAPELEGAEDAASATLSAEQVEQGRQIFNDWSCGACHVLGDAGGTGHIGPSFDGNSKLDYAFVLGRVTDGQGAMPGFGGQLTDEEIDIVSKYIMQAKK